MKTGFTILLFISFIKITVSQTVNLEWAKSMGGNGQDHGYSVAIGFDGSVYTTGNFYGTADFDPNIDTVNLVSNGKFDIFISKQDPSGNLVWVKKIGGTESDMGQGIVLDSLGNIYVTGHFNGTVDFDPNNGTNYLSTNNSADNMFLIKLNSFGNLLWCKKLAVFVQSICLDQNNNIITSGSFYAGGTVDFDPGSGVYNMTAKGSSDIFVSKIDSSGSFIWAKQFGGTGDEQAEFTSCDFDGNIYSTGYFNGTVDFNPHSTLVYNLTSNGDYDIFISKINSSGNLIWAKQIGGIHDDRGISIAVDNIGNSYSTGWFSDTIDFNPGIDTLLIMPPGYGNCFVCKLDSSGNLGWAKQLPDGNSITVNKTGDVYVAGYFYNTADFDPSNSVYNLSAKGMPDLTICKLNSLGALTWVRQIGGGTNSSVYPFSIQLDKFENIYTTGFFYGTPDFDPSSRIEYLINHPGGSEEMFVCKLSQCAPLIDTSVIQTANSLSANANATSYQWINCSTQDSIQGAINQTFSPSLQGNYAVIVNINGCSDISSCYNMTLVGKSKEDSDNILKVFPNPSSDQVLISTAKSVSNATLNLLNIEGQILIKQTNLNGNKFSIDLGQLQNGIYFIEISDFENSIRSKFFKN